MEEKSLREGSHNDSLDSGCNFNLKSPNKFMKKSFNQRIKNISQVSMMNNVRNVPFGSLGKSQFNLSSHFAHDQMGNASLLNNTSVLARGHRLEHSMFKDPNATQCPRFQDMQESLYLSPSKASLGMLKNQSLMGGQFKMVSLQAFDYGDKFYSAQKEKIHSQEEKKPGQENREYKELIDTFKNYQGKDHQTSTSPSTTTF